AQVPEPRRLSIRISEGDGIAIIARVDDVDGARAAEANGAKAIALERPIDGIRTATTLPLLWTGRGPAVDADALTIRPDDEPAQHELEPVVDVRDEDEDPLEMVLELLPDLPAGKLAIAEVEIASRDEVLALERAGIDAVLVPSARVA